MTTLAIEPYAMPTELDLPQEQVSWSIEPSRAALLIHDMQKYFLSFYGEPSPLRTDLIRNVALILGRARELSIPVFYTAQPGSMSPTDRGLLNDFWGHGMASAPEHRDVVEPLAPGPMDTVLVKWRYSAFFRTSLLSDLRASGRDQLVVCGVYAHVGCLTTAVDAYTHDIQPFLVGDAVADFSLNDHLMTLAYAAKVCARTVSTSALLAALPSRGIGVQSTAVQR
jgi:trans-2,3-dihydro-3-hydroxyanthranilic acid synthase